MKKKALVNLAKKLTSVKLPSHVFYVDLLSHRIYYLTMLSQSDSVGKCGCNEIDGSFFVTDGKASHKNVFTVPMTSCYMRLQDAIDYLELSNLRAQKRAFIQKESGYRSSGSGQISLMRQYPKIVLEHLRKEFKIEEDNPVTESTLKQSHFRLVFANGGFSEVMERIADVKFPALAGDESDDDE